MFIIILLVVMVIIVIFVLTMTPFIFLSSLPYSHC